MTTDEKQEIRAELRAALRKAADLSISLGEQDQFLAETINSWNCYVEMADLSSDFKLTEEKVAEQVADIDWAFYEEEIEEEDESDE